MTIKLPSTSTPRSAVPPTQSTPVPLPPPSNPKRGLPLVIGAVILVIVSATAGAVGYRLLDQQSITTASPLPEVVVTSESPIVPVEPTATVPDVAAPMPPSTASTPTETQTMRHPVDGLTYSFEYPLSWESHFTTLPSRYTTNTQAGAARTVDLWQLNAKHRAGVSPAAGGENASLAIYSTQVTNCCYEDVYTDGTKVGELTINGRVWIKLKLAGHVSAQTQEKRDIYAVHTTVGDNLVMISYSSAGSLQNLEEIVSTIKITTP